MARRKTLNDEGVAKLPARRQRYAHPDPELACHYIRVTPTGAKTFVVVARDREGRQRWETIGTYPAYNIEASRKRACEIIRAVREGRAAPDSFEGVAAKWRKLHCEARGLRSLDEIDRQIKRMSHEWTGRPFISIGRGDIARLLDKLESKNGRRQANYALQVFSSMANWYSARDDDYRSPVVRGMRRGTPTRRDRILDDNELRAIWETADGTFGALIKLLLLTGQRLSKVASMRWQDIDGAVWTIPAEDREKGNAGKLVLPDLAVEIINAQPQFVSNPYVLVGRGGSHIGGLGRRKTRLDAKLEGIAHWTLHDLRRTARSLMSRAGVRPDIAERVLGHIIKGVEGVYDRHSYSEEKAHALRALASLIDNIINPRAGNVVSLPSSARAL
jgi:integrase